MRIVWALLLFNVWLLACSGDCLSCHPKLTKTILSDARHKPMLSCIACHKNENSGVSECGKDCFSCHDAQKIDQNIQEHKVIQECRACHMNIPKGLELPQESSSESTLQDMLFKPGNF